VVACAVVDQLVRSSAVDVILVDSVAALVPQAEIEGEMGMVQVYASSLPGLAGELLVSARLSSGQQRG
jgi:RecA/RadA recombinase